MIVLSKTNKNINACTKFLLHFLENLTLHQKG